MLRFVTEIMKFQFWLRLDSLNWHFMNIYILEVLQQHIKEVFLIETVDTND